MAGDDKEERAREIKKAQKEKMKERSRALKEQPRGIEKRRGGDNAERRLFV